uniref:hypothetical protein n=1 Tax=Citrobacter werkmanii TaxID=67827 RepID=UPI00374EA88B
MSRLLQVITHHLANHTVCAAHHAKLTITRVFGDARRSVAGNPKFLKRISRFKRQMPAFGQRIINVIP